MVREAVERHLRGGRVRRRRRGANSSRPPVGCSAAFGDALEAKLRARRELIRRARARGEEPSVSPGPPNKIKDDEVRECDLRAAQAARRRQERQRESDERQDRIRETMEGLPRVGSLRARHCAALALRGGGSSVDGLGTT